MPATTEPAEVAGTPSTVDDVFGIDTAQQPTQETFASPEPSASVESYAQLEETFRAYAEGKRGELFGMENSMSLDEYLTEVTTEIPETIEPVVPEPPVAVAEESLPQETADPFAALTDYADTIQPPTPAGPETPFEDPFAQQTTAAPAAPQDDPFAQLAQQTPVGGTASNPIEQIAEKLKEAKRITPVINLSDRTPSPPSEADTPSETGFVTPTLAEIYAKQGWYDDAIKAYRTLVVNKPSERDKYEGRIRELEELKKQQAG
jgi:hypothetical protein